MTGPRRRRAALAAAAAAFLTLLSAPKHLDGRQPPAQKRPTYGSGVDLVVVHATVTDQDGYFVSGLKQQDFEVREDGRVHPITAFSSDRVPVSIGIAVDVSNSMRGEKLRAAKLALSQLLDELPDPQDEAFIYAFSDEPVLLQSWTTRRDQLRKAIDRLAAGGLTSLYDATEAAVRLAATGRHVKKALVIVSDGTDTASHTDVRELRREIRESEVLVYAIGIDAGGAGRPAPNGAAAGTGTTTDPRTSVPDPQFPPGGWPGRPPAGPGNPRPPAGPGPLPPAPPRAPIPRDAPSWDGGPVDAPALRELTNDSGGRTEIVRSASDLSPATAGIADELSRQYFLGYQGTAPRDGVWHTIEVQVRKPGLKVRARTGYFAPGK